MNQARRFVIPIVLAMLASGGAMGSDPAPALGEDSETATIALPASNGAWRATLTVSGGKIARFARDVVTSDGNAAATKRGDVTLEVHAFAAVASAVASASDKRWSVPKESTCCDRGITQIELERRLADGRVATHETLTAQSGTPLPPDAAALVSAIRDAFDTTVPHPTPPTSPSP